MIQSFKDKVAKIERTWGGIILFSVFSVVMLLNAVNTKLPLIGIPASLAAVYVCSVATGKIFFPHEKRFLRQVLGLATFVMAMALLGTFLILIAKFTETLSLVSFIAAGLILCMLSGLRKHANIGSVSEELGSSDGRKKEPYLLIIPFLLSVALAFYALLLARTGEGVISVWLTIPNLFLPVFFLSSLCLVIILFFTEVHVEVKLSLISVYSFLSHSLFLIVWYPGRYGDPWSHLGAARFIDNTGTCYAYDWLISQRLIADIVKYKSQYALVVFFKRMFSLDIYWVHVFFIPLFWSIFVPIFSYKLAELLATEKTKMFPFLAAISVGLFSPLIYWGTISVPNSLGFFFLLFSIMLLLYGRDTGSKRLWFLSLLASAASFLAHPQTGIFAFVFVFGAVIFQSRLDSILKIAFLVLISAVYPYISYLQGATFSLGGLLSLENFLSFQSDINTLLLVFAFLGLVFSIKGTLVKGKSTLMLFLFYVIAASNYYVSMYGMKNTLVPDRILPIMALLLVPFAALGLVVIANFLTVGFSRVKSNLWTKVVSPRALALLMICLFLSLQATSALYETYPRQEITEVQPAAYEVEAIQYIDSTAPGRYVVLGDTNLAGIAAGFLGIDYTYGAGARGMFGIPQWDWWSMKLYSKMGRSPSVSVLEEAMTKASVGVCFFVVSVRDPAYSEIVQRTSTVLPVDRVFGGGNLTVFKYVSAIVPITGEGPNVKVAFDDGAFTDAKTTFSYLVKSKVNYNATLSGHSSYNITDYPTYWTFLKLTVNGEAMQFDNSSDVNTFIYVVGLNPSDTVEVTWQANEHYPHAGWKEDAFKYGWRTHPLYAGTISPNITTDGSVLTLSWNFTTHSGEYQYYYHTKNVSVSTNDYPYILVKWKSTGPIATVAVAYKGSEANQYEVVPYSSESSEWTVNIVKLEPSRELAYVMVGITNLKNRNIEGSLTLYVDHILVCAPE